MFGFAGTAVSRRLFERQTPRRKGRHKPKARRARLQIETLEDRSVPSTLTGFSLVEQQGFPGPQHTFPLSSYISDPPTVFKDQMDQSWQKVYQTLDQLAKTAVKQVVSAYDINDKFAPHGAYSATLDTSHANPTLQIQYQLNDNSLYFTLTTNSPAGKWADPRWDVDYDMRIDVNLTLPSTLSMTSTVTSSATVVINGVNVHPDNDAAGAAEELGQLLGTDICDSIANRLQGAMLPLPNLVDTKDLNKLLRGEAMQGYTHLRAGLDNNPNPNNRNLLLTVQSPNLTINGSPYDDILLNTSPNGTVTVFAGGQSGTFDPGYLQTITINSGGGNSYPYSRMNILGVPADVSVKVNAYSNDQVTIGSYGSLANIAGPVNVNFPILSRLGGLFNTPQATLTIDDSNDLKARTVTITNSSVQFSGLPTISYSGGMSSLDVWGGSGTDYYNILSTSAPLMLVPGAGRNYIWIGNNDSLAGIAGTIDVEGSSGGQDYLTIDDHNDSGRNLTLTDSTVSFTGVPTITYHDLRSLTLVEAAGANMITVNSVPQGTPVTIYNSGSDFVTGPAARQVTFYAGLPSWDWNTSVVM